YRNMVVISVVSALLVGAIFTSGLGAMMPILQVLINHDTVQNWLDRGIAAQRMGTTLAEDAGVQSIADELPGKPLIIRVEKDSPADEKHVKPGWQIEIPMDGPSPLAIFADPQVQKLTLRSRNNDLVEVSLNPPKKHMLLAHSIAGHVPKDPVKA